MLRALRAKIKYLLTKKHFCIVKKGSFEVGWVTMCVCHNTVFGVFGTLDEAIDAVKTTYREEGLC